MMTSKEYEEYKKLNWHGKLLHPSNTGVFGLSILFLVFLIYCLIIEVIK
jgi:hypothetical protein